MLARTARSPARAQRAAAAAPYPPPASESAALVRARIAKRFKIVECTRRNDGASFFTRKTVQPGDPVPGGMTDFQRTFIYFMRGHYTNPLTGQDVFFYTDETEFFLLWTKNITLVSIDDLQRAVEAHRARGKPGLAFRFNLAITCAGAELERGVPAWRPQLDFIEHALWPFLRKWCHYTEDELAHAVQIRIDPVGPWRRLNGAIYDPLPAELPALLARVAELGIGAVHFSFFQVEDHWRPHITRKMRAAGFQAVPPTDAEKVEWLSTKLVPVAQPYIARGAFTLTTCSLEPALLNQHFGNIIRVGACVPELAVRRLLEAVGYAVPAHSMGRKRTGVADGALRTSLCTCIDIRDIGSKGSNTNPDGPHGRPCIHDCAYCFLNRGKGSTWECAAPQDIEDLGAH